MRRPTFHIRKGSLATIAAAALLVIATGGTSAYAAHVITSKQIRNNTIKSIDVRNGTLTAVDMAPGTIPAPYGGTAAYSRFHDAARSIQSQVSSEDPTVVSLDVPAGSYVFSATTWLNNGTTPLLARCTLIAGGDTDAKRIFLESSATGSYAQSAALQVVHTFASPGTAKLTCWSFGAAATANDTKLTGIRVDHLSNSAG
jgi:hypothetical protein